MIHIIGGGTFSYVRAHLALAAPARGTTARALHAAYTRLESDEGSVALKEHAKLHLTRMADPTSPLETNQDVAWRIDQLVADPATRMIYMNAALCDFEGAVVDKMNQEGETIWVGPTPSGKYAPRLRTCEGEKTLLLTPAEKVLHRVRRERKDIFLVAFKATCGATADQQYAQALNMLKASSANLVLANDVMTGHCMVVAPEETRYFEGPRTQALLGLVRMADQRSTNTFTRSTVVPGPLVPFQTSPLVPENLRQVVNWLTQQGAYKPFRGSTAGHFAARVSSTCCLTSRRKTNYTKPGGLDLVRVEYQGLDKVVAVGAKPSVGGQSQRIVFSEHQDLDCIVHAHIPMLPHPEDPIPVAGQFAYECGSHQCGANTSRNLQSFAHGIHAVMLDNHGPNIVFSRGTPAEEVIKFIQANFDVKGKTGGLVQWPQAEHA